MHLSTILAVLAPLTLATALPAAPLSEVISKSYYLKTQTINGKAKYNDIYVGTYHIGAGEAAAVLYAKKKKAFPCFINGTYHESAYPPIDKGTILYGMYMGTGGLGGTPVYINLGYDASQFYEKFSINDTGLQYTNFKGSPDFDTFGDWRVCEWTLQIPQLFWKTFFLGQVPGCVDVSFIPEYIQ